MAELNLAAFSVLVVDDVRDSRTLLKSLLRTFGIHDVLEASDGKEALEILRTHRRDMVITDLAMQPMDGLEFTRQLRKLDSGLDPFVPLLMVSAHNERELVKEALDAGVTDFLLKPIAANPLLQRLKAMLERPKAIIRQDSYCGPDRRRGTAGVRKKRRASDKDGPTILL